MKDVDVCLSVSEHAHLTVDKARVLSVVLIALRVMLFFHIIFCVFLSPPLPVLSLPIQTQEYTNQGTMHCCLEKGQIHLDGIPGSLCLQ